MLGGDRCQGSCALFEGCIFGLQAVFTILSAFGLTLAKFFDNTGILGLGLNGLGFRV